MSNEYETRIKQIINGSLDDLERGWIDFTIIRVWRGEDKEIHYTIQEKINKNEEQSDEEQH